MAGGERDPVGEARRLLEETVSLAKKLYGRRWMAQLEYLEELYEGDPWLVLEHLRREAEKRGLAGEG